MNLYCEEIKRKEFSDEQSKEAYLKACKWLAKNIYSRDEFAKYLVVNIEKKKKCKLPTFVVKIYISINEDEVSELHCKMCRTKNNIFYQIDKTDCDFCVHTAYKRRLENFIKGIRDFYEENF